MITYSLGYPNYEVEISLNKALLPAFRLDTGRVTRTGMTLLNALKKPDFAAQENHLKMLFASLPYD